MQVISEDDIEYSMCSMTHGSTSWSSAARRDPSHSSQSPPSLLTLYLGPALR